MDYNSQRKKMALPEYGRNIQQMVDHLLTIEDRTERNRAAQTIIDVMGNLYPYLRDIADFKHKLWDHIAIMADFKLDIDYPYDPPSPELLTEKPKTVSYNRHRIKIRHYGYNIEDMIDAAIKYEEGPEKELLIELLANHMKKSFLTWNKDAVTDEKIMEDLKILSKGKIDKPGMQLAEVKSMAVTKQKNKKQGGYKNHKKN